MKVERMKKRIGRVDQILRLMLTISFLLLSSLAFAQKTVTGTVVDATGEVSPLFCS